MQELRLDGSVPHEADTEVDIFAEEDAHPLLITIADMTLFDVEVAPAPARSFEQTPVGLMLNSELVAYIDSEIAEEMYPLIAQAQSMGFVVKMRARMRTVDSHDRRLELRGTWPSHLRTWLSLPAELQGNRFFEIEWARALWGNEFQEQRNNTLDKADQLVSECRFEFFEKGEFDVYLSDVQIGTVAAGYSEECGNAVARVASGQRRGLAKLRRLDDGHVVVGVSVPDPGSMSILQHSSAPFLWPDEREAAELAELD